jgi:hypothetical protein
VLNTKLFKAYLVEVTDEASFLEKHIVILLLQPTLDSVPTIFDYTELKIIRTDSIYKLIKEIKMPKDAEARLLLTYY